MKEYIQTNANSWVKLTTEFGKRLPQNMNCSLCGKQIENKRKRRRVDFVTNYEECKTGKSKIRFRGLKKIETKVGDPFFEIKCDKKVDFS